MNTYNRDLPRGYKEALLKSEEIGFTMKSDLYIGTLLQSLIASKANANILELGTGTGLALAWMLQGLEENSELTSIDVSPEYIKIAKDIFSFDQRVKLICADGSEWLNRYNGKKFDLIFADAWPGKYSDIEATLDLIETHGFYVIDDMEPQPNWPEGHQEKANKLIDYLEKRTDFSLTKLSWSTGIIIMAKIA